MAAQVAQRVLLDIDAVEQDAAFGVPVEARDQVGQGRFAAARTANQGDHLPGFGGEGNVLQHRLRATGVGEIQLADFQASGDPLAFDAAAVLLRRLVELGEDALGAGQALLYRRADFGQLADRLGQHAGGGDVGDQVAGGSVAAQVEHQEKDHGHGREGNQLQGRGEGGAGLDHAQLLGRVVLAGPAEAVDLVGLAAEAAHRPVTLNGFRGDVGQVAHGCLDLLALLAELAAGAADHDADDGQDGDHHRGQFPVHPHQVAEQEDDGQPFADDHLDRVGGGAGDHGHVVGDARDQVAGIVLVEIAVGQLQQLVEQRLAQVVDQAQRNLGQVIVAEEGADAAPDDDQHHQDRHAVHELHAAEQWQRVVGRFHRGAEAVDEILEHGGEHRLRRGEDDEADQADREQGDEGAQVAQEPEVDFQR